MSNIFIILLLLLLYLCWYNIISVNAYLVLKMFTEKPIWDGKILKVHCIAKTNENRCGALDGHFVTKTSNNTYVFYDWRWGRVDFNFHLAVSKMRSAINRHIWTLLNVNFEIWFDKKIGSGFCVCSFCEVFCVNSSVSGMSLFRFRQHAMKNAIHFLWLLFFFLFIFVLCDYIWGNRRMGRPKCAQLHNCKVMRSESKSKSKQSAEETEQRA